MGNIGISTGGQVIAAARDRYLKALTALVKLASLQVRPLKFFINFIPILCPTPFEFSLSI